MGKDINLGKGSYNRLWAVLGALADSGGSTNLKDISDRSGLPRSSTEDILKKVLDGQVIGIDLVRDGSTFTVKSWGEGISKKAVINFYKTLA